MSTPVKPKKYTHHIPSTAYGLYQYTERGFLVVEKPEENLQCGENMADLTESIESAEPTPRIADNKYLYPRKHPWGKRETLVSDMYQD